MNIGQNEKAIAKTMADKRTEGFIVQGVQTAQTGQQMQGVPIVLGFANDTRRFIISVVDEEHGKGNDAAATETASIIINPLVSPLFDSIFSSMAAGEALPINNDLKLCVEERRINATCFEKLQEFKVYLRTRKKGDKKGDKAEKTINSYFFDARCVLNVIAEKHFGGMKLSELNLSAITSHHVLEAERFLFKESGKAPSTLGRLTIGWNSFCTFLGMNGWKFIPQENIGREYKKDVISNNDVLRMLEYIYKQVEITESPLELVRLKRQEIALLLGWVQGMRSCEYINAKFNDVENHGKIVIKNSKHNGTREVALTDEDKFESLQREIAVCIAKEQDLQISIMGVETLLEQGDGSGLTDYFIYNKSLHLQEVGNDNLTFMVTTYLDYFDQSVFDRFHANPSSYFYTKTNGLAKDEETFKNLLLALYGDESSIRVRVCAEFELSLSGTLQPVHLSPRTANFPHWLPHPHLDGASCLGSNTAQINQLMMERKYLEAIEQAVSATKNINFADSAIAPKLIQAIRTGAQRFLELPNGDVVTPGIAIKWLNSKEGDDCYSA